MASRIGRITISYIIQAFMLIWIITIIQIIMHTKPTSVTMANTITWTIRATWITRDY